MEQASLVSISASVVDEIPLTSDKFYIGRDSSNSLAIADMKISGIHCILEWKNGNWYIFDKSSNGTWLNETLLEKGDSQLLTNGDVIWLSAKYRFMYKKTSQRISNGTTEEALSGNVTNSNGSDVYYSVLSNNCTVVEQGESSSRQSQPVVQPLPKCSSSPKPSCSKDNSNAKTENNTFKQVEEELHCSICREMFVEAVTLACSHTFCKSCIGRWQEHKTVCPVCRTVITRQSRTLVVDNLIEKVLESASEEVKQHRRELIAERKAALAASASSNTAICMLDLSRERFARDDSDDEFREYDDEDYNDDHLGVYWVDGSRIDINHIHVRIVANWGIRRMIVPMAENAKTDYSNNFIVQYTLYTKGRKAYFLPRCKSEAQGRPAG